jgi:hypothetical protein
LTLASCATIGSREPAARKAIEETHRARETPRRPQLPLIHDDVDTFSRFYLTLIGKNPQRSEELRRRTRAAIRFANIKFKRRGWTKAFRSERYQIARDFEQTSSYAVVRARFRKHAGKIMGTLGMTELRTLGGDPSDKLPMERSFGWKIPRVEGRPLLELRTYAMEETYGPEIFPLLFGQAIRWVHEAIRDDASLLDAPIIYTYGDKLSERFYARMGFERVPESEMPAKFYEGRDWYPLRTTPAKFFAAHRLITQSYVIENLKGPVDLRLQDGRTVVAKGEDGIYYLGKDRVGTFTPLEPFDTGRGLWGTPVLAASRTRVSLFDDGSVRHVPFLHAPAQVAPGIWADRGAALVWHPNGQLAYVSKLARATPLLTPQGRKIVAAPGSALDFEAYGGIGKVERLLETAEIYPGVFARARASVEWSEEGELLTVERLARRYRISSRIIADAGSDLELRLQTKGGRPSFIGLSSLAEGVRVRGRYLPAGHELHWYDLPH